MGGSDSLYNQPSIVQPRSQRGILYMSTPFELGHIGQAPEGISSKGVTVAPAVVYYIHNQQPTTMEATHGYYQDPTL